MVIGLEAMTLLCTGKSTMRKLLLMLPVSAIARQYDKKGDQSL